MQQVINIIKQTIKHCKNNGKMFHLPSLGRNDLTESRTTNNTDNTILYSETYEIKFNNGDWIKIIYESKDKCHTFQINPDKSVIRVTCSDSSFDFNDAWEEK